MISRWQGESACLHISLRRESCVRQMHSHARCAQQSGSSRPAVAPHQEDFLFSCLPDSFGVRSHVRYCTVTSVPTGISEKNLRAVSSGNRMQPCDAG